MSIAAGNYREEGILGQKKKKMHTSVKGKVMP